MTRPSQLKLDLENWPFALERLPRSSYLVGGAVRDGFLGRQAEYLDLDFVLSEQAVKTAREIASQYRAGFVLLDAERQIARVVFSGATVDFAQMEGETITEDLKRRDYTINAIAYNPFTQEVVDPFQGQADLNQQLIRKISVKNLEDDPLRLLRAYRQAAQLEFQLESETHQCLQQLASQLSQVASERICTELNYLLALPAGVQWIQQAWTDGLLSIFFPGAEPHFSTLSQIDSVAAGLIQARPSLTAELHSPLRDSLKTSRLAIAKLAMLLSSDLESAKQELSDLKYSKVEIQSALSLLKGWQSIQQTAPAEMSLSQQYLLFKHTQDLFPALAVVAISGGISIQQLTPLVDRYLKPDDPVAHPTPLLTGKTLMQALNLSPSPQIGELLEAIQLAQVEGEVSTVEAAVKLAQTLVKGTN
ncbi:MAG: CCA tRNA nucleotidyltransferase [Microcoleaceae cyanobacterium]